MTRHADVIIVNPDEGWARRVSGLAIGAANNMENSNREETSDRAIVLVVVVVGAIALSLGLSKLVVGVVNWWIAIGVSLPAALLGLAGDNLGDAIIFTIIVAAVTAFAFGFLPIPLVWKQVWLAVCGGACTSKLGMAAYTDFFK